MVAIGKPGGPKGGAPRGVKIASKPERELAAPSQKEENEIRDLCTSARDIFMNQPVLLELEAPIKICGARRGRSRLPGLCLTRLTAGRPLACRARRRGPLQRGIPGAPCACAVACAHRGRREPRRGLR